MLILIETFVIVFAADIGRLDMQIRQKQDLHSKVSGWARTPFQGKIGGSRVAFHSSGFEWVELFIYLTIYLVSCLKEIH